MGKAAPERGVLAPKAKAERLQRMDEEVKKTYARAILRGF